MFLYRMIAIVVLISLPITLSAENEYWTGLYQAVDHTDGSIDYMSIVANGDGSYTILGTISSHAKCSEIAGAPTAGWYKATGRISEGRLTREGVLVTCAGQAEQIKSPDSVAKGDNATDTFSLPVEGGKTLIFHRINRS